MEYTVEDLSPVKKKAKITVSPEEVEAAIRGAVALYRQNVQLDGFRKGKVPASVVEKRFHDSIYRNAREDLVNVHINDVLQKMDAQPVSAIRMDGGEESLEKGKGFEYSMEFEVLPAFDLPNYEGLEIEQKKIAAPPEAIDLMLERIRRERGRLEPVEGNGPAQDGQVANIDFETIIDGKPLEDFRSTGFDLEIASNAALPDFVEFVKTIPAGHTAEKVIHFPDDFIAKELAGRDATMKVTVHAVKERILPDLDDKFAGQMGQPNMEAVRENLAESYAKGMSGLQKSAAQRKLLDMLLRQVDYELPPSLVEMDVNLIVGDRIGKSEREGKNLAQTPEDLAKLKEEARPAAEAKTREKVLLMTIAKKENLEVPNQEVEREVYRGAIKMGLNVEEYFRNMRDTGMIYQLRDNMLCDKAMDLIYERAKIIEVEPDSPEDAGEAAPETPAAEEAQAAPETSVAKETAEAARPSESGAAAPEEAKKEE